MEFIFIKYLLIPIVVALAMVGFALYAKVNAMLRPGRLLFFVLISAVILALPALLGLMTYNFIPFGLVFAQVAFLGIGILMVRFFKSGLYQSIGLGENLIVQFLVLMVALVLGAWLFYLVFEWLGKLTYSLWVALSMIWFLLPIFYAWASAAFVKMPPPYYEVWDLMYAGQFDDSVWENADYLRMMNISLKIKKSMADKGYSSYPVLAPTKIPIGQWFMRYIKDQRIKFPNSPIEIESAGETYSWIFYTTRFFIFNRPLSPQKTFEEYKIRNKSEIYVRRVQKTSGMHSS
jgi:hypothetical protein